MKKISLLFAMLFMAAGFAFAGTATSAQAGGEETQQSLVKPDGGGDEAEAASPYAPDLDAMEQAMQQATEVTETVPFQKMEEAIAQTEGMSAGEGDLIVALICCFFLGGLAIHRLVLGGRGTLVLLYCITCGGIFGIVPLVDFVLLIIDLANGGGSRFDGNDSFIAW